MNRKEDDAAYRELAENRVIQLQKENKKLEEKLEHLQILYDSACDELGYQSSRDC